MAQRKVLLVEDEPAIAEPLAEALGREGFATDTAGYRRARRSSEARTVEPDLVLLDLMLPDGSGFDVCRELRADSQVPIIMLTARGDEADRVSASSSAPTTTSSSRSARARSIARIRAVLRRARARGRPPPRRAARDRRRCGSTRRAARSTRAGEPLELARKEFDLLAAARCARPAPSSRASG